MAFTRRGGRSPERAQRGKEAPAARAACPRSTRDADNPLRGCFGGDARGAAKGAQPHNRPHLAARRTGVPSSPEGEIPYPKGSKAERCSPARQVKLPAAQASQSPFRRKFRARRAERFKLLTRTGKGHRTPRRRYLTPERQNPTPGRRKFTQHRRPNIPEDDAPCQKCIKINPFPPPP